MDRTNKPLLYLGLFGFLIFTACSNKSGNVSKKRDNYTGTWQLDRTRCDGDDVSHTGLTDQFTLNMNKESGTNEVTSSSCIARTTFIIRKVNDIMTFENGSYTCSPSGCSVRYSVSFDGKQMEYKHSCPKNFPSKARIKAKLSVNGNHFTTELTSTNGMNCINTYTRRD